MTVGQINTKVLESVLQGGEDDAICDRDSVLLVKADKERTMRGSLFLDLRELLVTMRERVPHASCALLVLDLRNEDNTTVHGG
jgi:hypothetical protein